jgi:hypothetical protein
MIWKYSFFRKLRVFILCIFIIPVVSISADGQDATVILYEDDGFRGKSLTVTTAVANLDDKWDDSVSSLIILNGYWTFYEDSDFSGKNVTLGPGNYQSITDVGFNNDALSSLRPR